MSIPARARCLMLVMLWQAMAWLTPVPLQLQADAIAHLVVHTQDVDHHHHHDDDSLHLSSDSDSNAPHFHVDDGFHPIGLNALFDDSGFAAMQSTPPPAVISEPPTVFLDGLLRPPSLTV